MRNGQIEHARIGVKFGQFVEARSVPPGSGRCGSLLCSPEGGMGAHGQHRPRRQPPMWVKVKSMFLPHPLPTPSRKPTPPT